MASFTHYTNSLRKWFTYSKFLEENRTLKEKYKNQRCFVIGNGVSLNTQDISKLKDEVTIVSNSFYKHPILNYWQPTFYCIVDPIFFTEGTITDTFLSELTTSVKKTNFIFPLLNKDIINTIPVLNNYKKNFVFYTPSLFHKSLAEKEIPIINFTKSIPGIQSVSQMGIMLAIYVGCSPIYLIGMDHDWLKYAPDMNNERSYQHFYGDQIIDDHVKTKYNHTFSYKEDMVNMVKLWEGYENLLKYAQKNNTQIINATNNGYLDVFKRIDYDSLFWGDLE